MMSCTGVEYRRPVLRPGTVSTCIRLGARPSRVAGAIKAFRIRAAEGVPERVAHAARRARDDLVREALDLARAWSSPGQKTNVSKPRSRAKPVSVSIQWSGGPLSKPARRPVGDRAADVVDAADLGRVAPRRRRRLVDVPAHAPGRGRASPSRATAPSRRRAVPSARAPRGLPTPSQIPIGCGGGSARMQALDRVVRRPRTRSCARRSRRRVMIWIASSSASSASPAERTGPPIARDRLPERTRAEPELEATAREHVERRRLLREHRRQRGAAGSRRPGRRESAPCARAGRRSATRCPGSATGTGDPGSRSARARARRRGARAREQLEIGARRDEADAELQLAAVAGGHDLGRLAGRRKPPFAAAFDRGAEI